MSKIIDDIKNRPYPRLMGNQWIIDEDGSLHNSDNETRLNFIAEHLDYITINKYGDLFLDFQKSCIDSFQGLVRFKNDLLRKSLSLSRRVYVFPYHNMTDCWYYQSINSYPNESFWMQPDGQNIGTWDYMTNHDYWLSDTNNEIVTYPWGGYTNAQRRFWDSRISEVQEYWANHAIGITMQGFDGIFADNWLRSGVQNVDLPAIQNGWNTTGQKYKDLMPDKVLIGNSPAYSPFTSRDICMLEDRISPALTGDYSIPAYLTYSDNAASMNQLCQDTYWDETKGELETFRLPMCLLTDNVFGVCGGTKQGRTLEDYILPILNKVGKIGTPTGDRYIDQDVLTRDYTEGKVIMNNTDSVKNITLQAGVYKNIDDRQVDVVELQPLLGIILKKV